MAFKSYLSFLTASIIAVLVSLTKASTEKADIYPGFGERCDLTKCAKSLQCTDRVCKCGNPDYQIYDATTGLCRSIVGTKCGIKERVCVHGGVCTKSKCRCKAGYISTGQRTCENSYGDTCTQKDDICAAPFVCKEGKCGCRNADDIYSNNTRMCHCPVGYPCSDKGKCVEGSYCATPNGESYKGTCECSDGFKLDQNSDSCVSTACKSNFFRPLSEITNETAFPFENLKDDFTQLYSCRVKINENFAVGEAYIYKQSWGCVYEFNGKTNYLNDNGFEVLSKPSNGTQLTWVAGNHASDIPEQALLADGKFQYVVRCKRSLIFGKERLVPGRLVASRPRKVLYTWDGITQNCDEYEMLICSHKNQ